MKKIAILALISALSTVSVQATPPLPLRAFNHLPQSARLEEYPAVPIHSPVT